MPRQLTVCAAIIDKASSSCWLIDATPDFKDQYHNLQSYLESSGLQKVQLRGVLLTHLHMGHYLGLMQFGREGMDWQGLKSQVYGTQSVTDFFTHNQPWQTYLANGNFKLHSLRPDVLLQLSDNIAVRPVLVPHRAEFSNAVGYYVKGPAKLMFYLPDIDSWDTWLSESGVDIREVVASVDTAFLDACFYSGSELPGRDIKQIPHPLIVDTAERLKDVPDKHVVLVHMNHSNPVYRVGPESDACAAAGLEIGQQGAVYDL
eukprot:gene6804-7020_t